MIDRQKFNDNYQDFGPKIIIEIVDMFAQQQPEILGALAKNIADHDFVNVKLNAHKLKGTCGQLFDLLSWEHAKRMEDAALLKTIEIVELLINDYPDPLRQMRQEFDDNDLFRKKIVPAGTLKTFFAGFTDTFSLADERKLKEIEERKMAEGIPQMYSDLNTSSAFLLEELLAMKKAFTRG